MRYCRAKKERLEITQIGFDGQQFAFSWMKYTEWLSWSRTDNRILQGGSDFLRDVTSQIIRSAIYFIMHMSYSQWKYLSFSLVSISSCLLLEFIFMLSLAFFMLRLISGETLYCY